MATDDVYPMPLFVQFLVSDLGRSAAWYERLGFSSVYSTPAMAHLRYRKYADLMLVEDAGDSATTGRAERSDRGSGVAVYLTVDGESVDQVAARAVGAGGGTIDGPRDTPWNTRELRVADPDGYALVFSEVVDEARSFDEVVGEPVVEE